jgi:hypothetical protein
MLTKKSLNKRIVALIARTFLKTYKVSNNAIRDERLFLPSLAGIKKT